MDVPYMCCSCVHLQPCYWAGCCRSRWSSLGQRRLRSDHIQWDMIPSRHCNCADAQTSCGSHPGHGRWNRSSYWCGNHTWQWGAEGDGVIKVSSFSLYFLVIETKARWIYFIYCMCLLLFIDGSELLRKACVFRGQKGNHLSCYGCSTHTILVQYRGTTHIPCNIHAHTQLLQ